MRAVIQRVTRAEVRVGGATVGAIGPGLVVLLAVARDDTEAEAAWLARKIPALRIFAGPDSSFARALPDTGGALLVVSQFTLYGDARKGRRPSFAAAAAPEHGAALYEWFVQRLRDDGWTVATGAFGAQMEVELVNDGPVTLVVDRDSVSR